MIFTIALAFIAFNVGFLAACLFIGARRDEDREEDYPEIETIELHPMHNVYPFDRRNHDR